MKKTNETELASLEAQLVGAFRAGFLKGSWDCVVVLEDALLHSETGQSIARLKMVAIECGEPVATRVNQFGSQVAAAYAEGFALSRAGGTFEGGWVDSLSRKSLYMEVTAGLNGLAPGNFPKVGERWHILRDNLSACQTVDVLDVTAFTVSVRAVGAIREERLALDMTRFIEKPVVAKDLISIELLMAQYLTKLDFNDTAKVVAEAKRILSSMDDSMLKCVMHVLTEKCSAIYSTS